MANEVEVVVTSKNRAKGGLKEAEEDTKKTGKEMENTFSKVGKSISSNLLGKLRQAVVGLASVGATIAGIGSLAGPATSGLLGLAKGAVAVGQALASVAPAVAVLPAIAAGFLLVQSVARVAMPAMGEALTPIVNGFTRLQGKISDVAAKGLRPLAAEFVKVNLPVIGEAMIGIAGSMNRVAVATGRWVNSLAGQNAIGQVTISTAIAMQNLEGPVTRVAIAFGNMMDRIGGQAIIGVADALGKAADATARWLDSLTSAKVDDALAKLSVWGQKVKEVGQVLRDVGQWMSDNQGKVKAFSDALAVAGIALGIATGNIPAIVAGSFSLVVNHWEQIKTKFTEVQPFFAGVWNSVRNDPSVAGIFDSIKTAWKGFVDSFKQEIANIGPKFRELVDALKQAWVEWGPIIKAWWDGVGKPVFSALGTALGAMLILQVQVWTGTALALEVAGGAFRVLLNVVLFVLGSIVNSAAAAWGWLPGIGPKLQAAADNFNSFRDRVNAALDGIRDKQVNVNVVYHQKGAINPATGNYQASGIGFQAHGGIRGAASGRLAGGLTMVGEHGRELVQLAPGSHVRSNPDTERIMSGASAGRGGNSYTIINNIAPGGDLVAAGAATVAAIRQYETYNGAGWRSG